MHITLIKSRGPSTKIRSISSNPWSSRLLFQIIVAHAIPALLCYPCLASRLAASDLMRRCPAILHPTSIRALHRSQTLRGCPHRGARNAIHGRNVCNRRLFASWLLCKLPDQPGQRFISTLHKSMLCNLCNGRISNTPPGETLRNRGKSTTRRVCSSGAYVRGMASSLVCVQGVAQGQRYESYQPVFPVVYNPFVGVVGVYITCTRRRTPVMIRRLSGGVVRVSVVHAFWGH